MIYAELIKSAKRITILTGAGVSTESGIPDFRTTDDTWTHKLPRAEVMSLPYFLQEPKDFWNSYRDIFDSKSLKKPNETHFWITSLEENSKVTVITQNVDGLHKAAGSSKVIEAHGNMHEVICISCQIISPMISVIELELPLCENCSRPLKPNVSLFMEGINGMGKARKAILKSDLFLALGTTLRIGPINELPYVAIYGTSQGSIYVSREKVSEAYDFTHSFIGELKEFIKLAS